MRVRVDTNVHKKIRVKEDMRKGKCKCQTALIHRQYRHEKMTKKNEDNDI